MRFTGVALSLRWQKIALRVFVLLLILGAWQMLGQDRIRIGLPTFTRTFEAFTELIFDGRLPDSLWATNQALVGGFVLAMLCSLPLGIAMGSMRTFERLAQPYVTILLAVPMIAVVPIIQAAFGLSLMARIVIVFVFCFPYLVVNVAVGVRHVDPILREMAHSFGASRWQMLRRVVLPGAVPAVMAGVRLGLGRAIIGMVVAELALIGAGVGSLILDFETRFQPAYVLAVILAVIIQGVLLMEIARRVELHLVKWKGAQVVE